MPQNLNNSHPTEETGSILNHLDKLEPSKGGKYVCPVCGGNDLSIATRGSKAGAVTCFNNGCSWKSIMDAIAPLPSRGTSSSKTQRKKQSPFKSKSQKEKDAAEAEILIDSKVTELVYGVECESYTPASALVALAAWCKEHGHNSFTASQLLKERLNELKNATGYDDDEMAPHMMRDYKKIVAQFGDRFRYNQLFKQVELDGEYFDPAMSKIELIVTHKMKLKSGRDDIGDCVLKIARENQYHPVQEYLSDCYRQHGHSTDHLIGFADRILGAKDHIHQTIVCKFLIAAVARAFEPGCQVDTALILQGKQGAGKSSFFRILASPEWFDDSFGNASDKDERLKVHSAWILEWAELETIFKRKDMSAVKAFMTTKIDRIRPPYGRSVEFMPRSSVFCGTTNQTEFLSDTTGNRRFWVLPVSKDIDCQALEAERDRVWAAAVTLYKSGVQWWLTPEEERAMNEHRRTYESTDVWEDEIDTWLEGREVCSVQEILEKVLGIELHQQNKKEQLRVRDILTRLNWLQVPNAVFYQGKRVRVWHPEK